MLGLVSVGAWDWLRLRLLVKRGTYRIQKKAGILATWEICCCRLDQNKNMQVPRMSSDFPIFFPHGKTGGNFEILDPNVAGSESQFFPAWGNRLCVAWNLGMFLLRWLISVGCRHNATDTTFVDPKCRAPKKAVDM